MSGNYVLGDPALCEPIANDWRNARRLLEMRPDDPLWWARRYLLATLKEPRQSQWWHSHTPSTVLTERHRAFDFLRAWEQRGHRVWTSTPARPATSIPKSEKFFIEPLLVNGLGE
jgi:hypothetical protein